MIDPKLLKENLSVISSNLKNKNYTLDKDEFLKVDSDRKELILENESLKNKKNLLYKIKKLKNNNALTKAHINIKIYLYILQILSWLRLAYKFLY